MADKKYTVMMELRADGSQARSEVKSVGDAAKKAASDAAKPLVVSATPVVASPRLAPRPLTVRQSDSNLQMEAERRLVKSMARPVSIRQVDPSFQGQSERRLVKSMSRPLSLRPVDPEYQKKISELQAKSVSIPIRADGAPAVEEAEKTVETVNDEAKKVKPLSLDARPGVGLYDKLFKGLGSDLSRGIGLDKALGASVSGLGKIAEVAGMAFSGLGKVAGIAFRGILGGIRLAGSLLRTGLMIPIRLATTAFRGLGIAAAAAAAGVYAAAKALGPASEIQQFSMQIETMLKSADKAKIRLGELSRFARETNFSPRQVIEAGNLMEAFGFYSMKNLKLAGDAANAFGKDIKEIVNSLNYLATGRGGEAFESLARIGVTREKLKPFGVEFAKSGELVTEPKKALDAVLSYFSATFGGMTEKQSKTWKGAIQQIGGEVYDAFARGFKLALQPLTDFVRNRAIPLVGSIGDSLEQIKWDKILAKPLKMLGGVSELVRQAMDPKTREAGMGNLKSFGAGLWDGLKDVIGQFPLIGKAVIRDLAGTLEAFIGSGGMGKVLSAGFDMLSLAWEVGASLMSAVLTSFSRKFQSDLKVIVEKLTPGGPNVETNTRRRADETAAAMIIKAAGPGRELKARQAIAISTAEETRQKMLREYAPGGSKFGSSAEFVKFPGELEKQAGIAAGEASNRVITDTSPEMNIRIAKEIIKDNAEAAKFWDRTVSKFMQWDDNKTSPFYREPGAISAKAKKISDTLGTINLPVSFSNTEAAVKTLKDKAAAAMSIPVDMLAQADRKGTVRQNLEQRVNELRKRRESLVDDPELAKLKRTGWDSKGRERTSMDWLKNMQAKQARFDYGQRFGFVRSKVFNVDNQIKAAEEAKAKNASRILEDYQMKKMLQTPQRQEKSRDRQVEMLDDMRLMLGQTKLQQQAMLQQLQSINRAVVAVMGA